MLLIRSIFVEIALLAALHDEGKQLFVVLLGSTQLVVFDLEQVQVERILLGFLEEPLESVFLATGRCEIAGKRTFEIVDFHLKRRSDVFQVSGRRSHVGVIGSLARSDQCIQVALRAHVLSLERLHRGTVQNLADGEIQSIVRGDLHDLVPPGCYLLRLRASRRQGGAQLLHLVTQHVRLVVHRQIQDIFFFLVLVECQLAVVEVLAEGVQLVPQPIGRGHRCCRQLVEIILHVGIDERREDPLRAFRIRVAELHLREAAILHRVHGKRRRQDRRSRRDRDFLRQATGTPG